MGCTINDRKTAVIGCGFVGAASAFAIMESGLFSEMVLIDADHDKAEVAVRRSFYSGSYYELSKNDGEWEVVRQTSRWMN